MTKSRGIGKGRGEANKPKPVRERFWRHVVQDGTDSLAACWIWVAWTNKDGYGLIRNDPEGRASGGPKTLRAHRWSYEHVIGPIPPGLDLDHLCRRRACVNPFHLDPVTKKVNTLRGELPSGGACRRGHPRTPENTYMRNDRPREFICRPCSAIRAQRKGSSK